MAYLVKGRTFSSYWDVRWNKTIPEKFEMVFDLEDNTPETVAAAARWIHQASKKQVVVIDSVEAVGHYLGRAPNWIDYSLPWYEQKIVAFDVETTGRDPVNDRIAEIAFCEFDLETKSFKDPESFFINDGVPMDPGATEVNGITDEMLQGHPTFEELYPLWIERGYLLNETILLSHNRGFDMAFYLNSMNRSTVASVVPPCWCSMEMSIRTPMGQDNNRLGTIAEVLEVDGKNTHRAGDDAWLCGEVFLRLARRNRFFHTATTKDVMDYFDNNPTMVPYGYSRF